MRPTDKPTKTETASPYAQVCVGPTHISLVAETGLRVASFGSTTSRRKQILQQPTHWISPTQPNEKNIILGPNLRRERLVSEIYPVSTRSFRDNRMLVIILNPSSFHLIMFKSIFLDPITPESKFSYASFIKSTFNQQFMSPGIHCRRHSLIILTIIHHCTVERHFVDLTLDLIRIRIFEKSPGSSLCGLSSSSVSLSL